MPMVFPKRDGVEGPGAGMGAAGFPKVPVPPVDPKKSNERKADGAPAPPEGAKADASAPEPEVATAPKGTEAVAGVHKLLEKVRRDLEGTVARETKRIEDEFGSIVQALSMQLLEAREDAKRAKNEVQALRYENEQQAKKVKVLKELQEKLKEL